MTPTVVAVLGILVVAGLGALLAFSLWLAWPPVKAPSPAADEEWRWPRV